MKYKIGTRIDFIDEGESEEDNHEYYEITAYAITKDDRVVYLVWSSYNEYADQHELMTEEALTQEIKEHLDCNYSVKIREEE